MAIKTTLIDDVKGDVVMPEHPDYPAAIARWAINAERKAKLVVFAKDAEDVATAIKYAKENGLPIAIRGGGHNAAGASSALDGLVVDLSRYLNGVRIDPEKKLGYVGGGAIWKTVDTEAIKHGLATVGGTVNHTGVGGLTLGGGYGWLSGRYGLAADNLRQATVVTADGAILTASDAENPDLFWAIRGGGCNFGVVTEFVFQLYPQRPTVYAGFVVFRPDALEKIIETTKNWWPTAGENEAMCQIATLSPFDGQPVMVLFLFYNGSEAEGKANFKDFLEIGPMADRAKEIPYEELNAIQNPMAEHGKGCYLKGISQKVPDYPSTKEVLVKVGEIGKSKEFIPAIIYEYFPLSKINSVPINSTAFRREVTSNVLLSLGWEGVKDKTNEARAVAKELIDAILRGQVGLTKSEKLGYTNYDTDVAAVETPDDDKAKLAFASNYPRLQEIKKKFDPENTFNKWFPVTPA